MKMYDKGGFQAEMDKYEASRTLGVGTSSPPERIQAAHRRLMKILHPDGNGSACVALPPSCHVPLARHSLMHVRYPREHVLAEISNVLS